MNDADCIAAPYLTAPRPIISPPLKNGDARRWLRVALAEKAMGIPWWKPRCKRCGAIITGKGRTGMCMACCGNTLHQKTAPCRAKAERLYRSGARLVDIARVCGISRERVCQFLRPTGILGTTKTEKKRRTRAQRRVRWFQKHSLRLQRKIVRRYFAVRLYKAGYGIKTIRAWVPSVQHYITQAKVQKRGVTYRGPFGHNRKLHDWASLADGKWHRVKTRLGQQPVSAYRFGRLNGMKTQTRRVSRSEFMVRFTTATDKDPT